MKKMFLIEFDDKHESELRGVLDAFCNKKRAKSVQVQGDEDVESVLMTELTRRNAIVNIVAAENELRRNPSPVRTEYLNNTIGVAATYLAMAASKKRKKKPDNRVDIDFSNPFTD